MSQFIAFVEGVRDRAIEHAFASLKSAREYTFAYLKTMDRSEAVGCAVAAVALVLLIVALA